MCPKKETCRFCEDIVEWNYQRFKSEDNGRMLCRQCNKQIESSLKESVTTVFVLFVLDFWTIVYCKFCPPNNQCMCDDTKLFSDSDSEQKV